MYAGVPCYNLKKLHLELAADMPVPRTLMEAWREMRATWRRQRIDPGYQFDTQLPAAAGGLPRETVEELESSIGELAPRGLR